TLGSMGAIKTKSTAYANTFDASDGNGFISVHETQFLGDPAIQTDDTYSRQEFANDPGQWRVGVLKRRYTTDEPGGAGGKLSEELLYYDSLPLGQIGSNGNLTRVERWTGNHYAGRSFSYNSDYGLVASTTNELGNVTYLDYGQIDTTFTYP